MIIRNIRKDIIYRSRVRTLRGALEEAHAQGVALDSAYLRGARLQRSRLDEGHLVQANLWGADLSNADLAGADCRRADFRRAVLKDTCLAEADLAGADFRGAYFSGTIISEADFSGCPFSCPSLFDLDLASALSFEDAVYWHRGETACSLSPVPWVIRGPGPRIVLFQKHILYGGDLISRELIRDPAPFSITGGIKAGFLQNDTKSYP